MATKKTDEATDAPAEEEVAPYTTVDHFAVWDSKGAALVSGLFAVKDEAEAELVNVLSKSHQWLSEHLSVVTLPKG